MLTQASELQTPLHRLAVKPKFIATIALTVAITLVRDWQWQIVISLAIFAVYAGFGRSFLKAGLQALTPLLFFIIAVLIWNALQGQWSEGVRISFRLVNAIAIANLFTLTTRLDDMLVLFQTILRPLSRLGVNTQAISLALALTIRFIPVLRIKAAQLRESWRARSLKRANWRIVMPVTILALDDATQIADALRARGGISHMETKNDKRT